jgi:TRAP-type C4-dicarboxylate transport system substrate-binding protein
MKHTWRMLFFVLTIALLLSTGTSLQAKVITLSMASQNPDTSWSNIHAIVPWAEQVEKATNGQVKINIYPSQTLAKGKDAWSTTKLGVADISWCFHGYWPGQFPLADVISLPALPFKTAEKGSEVLWKLYEKFPEIQKEFADNKILVLFTSNPYNLITTEKQVKTLEDVAGMKIRMTGGPPTDMVLAMKGVPTLIPMPDCYLALQKGVVDGMGAPWEAIHGFRLYEVVKYYTETPFPAVYFSIAMNKKKWESLSKDIQDAIMSVSGLNGSKFWGKNHFDTAKKGVMDKLAEQGKTINVVELSDAERQRWIDVAGKPIWDKWVKDMEAKGFANAHQILETTIELSK